MLRFQNSQIVESWETTSTLIFCEISITLDLYKDQQLSQSPPPPMPEFRNSYRSNVRNKFPDLILTILRNYTQRAVSRFPSPSLTVLRTWCLWLPACLCLSFCVRVGNSDRKSFRGVQKSKSTRGGKVLIFIKLALKSKTYFKLNLVREILQGAFYQSAEQFLIAHK